MTQLFDQPARESEKAPGGTSDIRMIPLDRLEGSEENVRKIGAGAAADQALVASIAAVGLLENLVVHRLRGPADRFGVSGGRRRLLALRQLVLDGALTEDHPVPCLVLPEGVSVTEISLAENLMRAEMHPADQVRAFVELAEEGQSVGSIAFRFGISEHMVSQRLRLGNVASAIMVAFREGKVNLELLRAYAATGDQDLQLRVWGQQQEAGQANPSQVRRLLQEGKALGTSNVARFVGVDAYEAAGGAVTRDLFGADDASGMVLEDPMLLERLALAKLEEAGSRYRDEWKWVECHMEPSRDVLGRFTTLAPEEGEVLAVEHEEMSAMATRQGEFRRRAKEGLSPDEEREYQLVRDRLGELHRLIEGRKDYTPEQKAASGCIVSMEPDGKLKVRAGLLGPEDTPPAAVSGPSEEADDQQPEASGNGRGRRTSGQTGSAGDVSNTKPPEKKGLSDGLLADLRLSRQAIIQSHLAHSYEDAFDLALFQLAQSVFGKGSRSREGALDMDVRVTGKGADIAVGALLPLDWTAQTDLGLAFEALRDVPNDRKEALFAACIAAMLKGQLAGETKARPEVENVVEALNVEFAALYRPSAEGFWSRLSKAQIMEIAEQTLGDEWVKAHGKDKKGELVAAVDAAFAAGDEAPEGVSEEGWAKALAWSPPGFEPRVGN